MKKIFLLFTILLYGVVSFAQENVPDYTPNILPRSPQAEQYMRYGEIPVGLSTGVPEISIPIYTIQVGGLSIPISISYHASGNKISDVASPVGLGWVLNAGGMISQTVSNGVHDDLSENYEFSSARQAYERLMQEGKQLTTEIDGYWYHILTGVNYYKTVSDRFSYNFNGNNGVFRKDINTKKYKTIPQTNIKIEQPNKESFIITDTYGNIWTFERFLTVSALSGEQVYEYHVTKVKNPSSSVEIKFQYEKGNMQHINNYGEYSQAFFAPIWEYTYIEPYTYGVELRADYEHHINYAKDRANRTTPILLTKIQWQDSEIEFSYISDRQDIPNGERLDKIVVKSGNERIETKLSNNKYLNFSINDKRLLLDNIKVNSDLYSFDYKTIQTPSFSSFNCNADFWGYYNGKNAEFWRPVEPVCVNYSKEVVLKYIPSREVDTAFTQIGIIKEIKYPTGGSTKFIFENNQGSEVYDPWFSLRMNTNAKKYFGGLRIKQISNFNQNILVNKKTYEYNGGPSVTINLDHFYNKKVFLQKALNYPNLNHYYSYLGPYSDALVPNLHTGGAGWHIYSQYIHNFYWHKNSPNNPWGQPYCYNKVVEYDGDISINNGKTEYQFIGENFGFATNLDKYEYGIIPNLLISKKIFKNNSSGYKLVQETLNAYDKILQNNFIVGVSVEDNDKIFLYNPIEISPFYGRYVNKLYEKEYYYSSFRFTDITASSNHYLLKSTEETSYTDKGIIKSTISYDYDPQLRVLSPIKTQTTNSQGQTIIGTTTYPFNYSGGIYSTMIDRNMLNYPVEQITQTGATETTRVKTEYGLWNNLVLPVQIFSSVNGGTLTKAISYDKYNSKGNLLQYTMRDGVPVSFVWGYNYQYPVAKIANITYDKAKIALGQASNTDDLPYLQTLTGASLQAELNKLRSISGTFVETYEYKPLFGIIKATDPSGFATTYDYDSFGRLEQIKDHNGKILEKYKYNYK